MKALGIKQFHQMKFNILPIEGTEFEGILGEVARHFIAVIKGYSGNGKTEFTIRLCKLLAKKYDKVDYLSYEQRHSKSLQDATIRNNMEDVTGKFIPVDPLFKKPANVNNLEHLCERLDKRGSAECVVIDSVDYTGWNKADYLFLKERYSNKKTFIFIAHSDKSGKLRKQIAEDIWFDGDIGICVKTYIGFPEKNRYGGFEPYVIWEKKARELNPLFFDPKNKVKAKSEAKQPELFEKSEPESKGVTKKDTFQTKGVNAKSKLKKVG